MKKLVVLDGHTLNPGDLSWSALEALANVTVHDRTGPDQILKRSTGAELLLTNKTPLRSDTLQQLPELRYIGVLATGYDVVDTAAAVARGIVVTNIPVYGTESVAQFAFALLLELCHHVGQHAESVRKGDWSRNPDWSMAKTPLMELAGKTMGIVGFGRIGRQTARIAEAFGMRVIPVDISPDDTALHDLLASSDVVSLHCPSTPETRGMINSRTLALMKPSAFLINSSRGALVVEQDLADALNEGRIAGAGLDVLPTEPPSASPLLTAKNCIVTPHIAWATREARSRLMEFAAENVAAFLRGAPVNVVGR
jgi:glycerate dehydrogenase